MNHWSMIADAIIRWTIVRVLLFKKNQTNQNSAISTGDHSSVILRTSCGLLYPVPRSIRSPQIEIYQNGLRSLTLVNFRSAADIAQWFDKFLEHAMLINMHEFFTGRVIFSLHDACDAKYHLENSSLSSPFQMKNVEENVQYLEYISPTTIVNPSNLPFFPEEPITVYVTKGQLEVVEYITKCTGQFLKDLMSVPSNSSYCRLITIDYKINFDQCVQMLESIYRYAVTNQKGKDVPYLCRKFYSLGPCTLEAGIHYLELVQSALHRHHYTYLSEFNCDVVQIISCLYPGHLKNQLHQSTAKDDINWQQFKILADSFACFVFEGIAYVSL
jgi:hypothetical protein